MYEDHIYSDTSMTQTYLCNLRGGCKSVLSASLFNSLYNPFKYSEPFVH